jgi:hypothetical protein
MERFLKNLIRKIFIIVCTIFFASITIIAFVIKKILNIVFWIPLKIKKLRHHKK